MMMKMKKEYIQPHMEVVKLNLLGSVLENADVIGGSDGADGSDAQAKGFSSWSDFDEADTSDSQHWESY